MKYYALIIACILVSNAVFATDAVNPEIADEPAANSSINELSTKATDPTASLMALNFQGIYTGGFHGDGVEQDDSRTVFQFRPVIPLTIFDQANILRLTIPYQVDGRGDEGWGSISIFDMMVFNHDWGRWGLGPVMSFDTTGTAPDEYVLGPAVGAVYKVNKKLNVGLFSQNVFWSGTGVSQLQPIIAYQLGKGWALSLGDLQFVYDWKSSRWVNAPIGFQIGKVLKIGKLPARISVNPQYNLIDEPGLSQWSVTLTFTALFPSF